MEFILGTLFGAVITALGVFLGMAKGMEQTKQEDLHNIFGAKPQDLPQNGGKVEVIFPPPRKSRVLEEKLALDALNGKTGTNLDELLSDDSD